MGGRIKTFLINTGLVVVLMCLVMCFLILCNKYEQTHNTAQLTYNEMKASEYKALTEQYKSETARLNYEIAEARLNAFLKKYGGENDASGTKK